MKGKEGLSREKKKEKKEKEKREENGDRSEGQKFIRATKQCKIMSESVHVLLFCC